MGTSAKKRILVVDDDPGQAKLVSLLLKSAFDATVETVYSYADALEEFAAEDYDLITLDYQLPDGDGLMLLDEIQKKTDSPPVMIITGHGDEQTAVAAFKAGAYGYVVKDKRMSTMIVEEARSALARAGLVRTEAALADSQSRYQEIFEASTLGIITFDEKGMMENTNTAFMDIFGIGSLDDTKGFGLFARGYLDSDAIRDLKHGESITALIEYDFDKVAREGLYTPTRTGIAYVEGTVTPLMLQGEKSPHGYLCQIADVTERERKNRAIKAQRDLASAVLKASTLEEALPLVLSAVLKATGLDGGGIYVLDKATGGLDLKCHEGLSDEFVSQVDHYDRDSDQVRLVLSGEPAFLQYPLTEGGRGPIRKEGLKGLAVVPLVYADEVIGSLNVASRTMEEIDTETREVILSIASEAAQAVRQEMTAAALSDERDMIASVLDALPIGVLMLNPDGSLIMQNRATRELAKLSDEECAERTDSSPEWETTDWDGNPIAYEETPIGIVMATKKPAVGIRLSALDGLGQRSYVSESAAPIFDERGEIRSVVLSIEDMTDLRNALEAVRQAEKIYRETVDSLNEGLWVLDADAVTTYVSDRMAEMLGFKPEEMVGRSVYDFADDRGREVMKHNLGLRRQGISQSYDFDFIHKDGSRVSAYLAAAPVFDGKGTFIGSHAGVLDITGRKRTERALQESLSLLETQLATSPDAITVSDVQGYITSASRRTAEMHGYDSPAEVIGMSALDLIAPEARELALANLFKTLEEGVVHDVEYEMLKKDGSRFIGGLNAAVLRDAEGEPIGFIATTRDITRQRRHERELRELNAELERFAHVVSHDLKGPISALIASSHMLNGALEEVTDKETHDQLSEIAMLMEGSATRAFNLINDLLLLAESGQVPRKLEEVSIDEIVEMVLLEKQSEIEERGVKIERDKDLGTILADKTHMYQLFSNLISNGLHHNDAGEPVLRIFRTREIGGHHGYSVCDNGSGIKEDLLESLFEPFARSEQGGAGLGLSIVSKVVEIYGGSVNAYNDQGACFDIALKDYPSE